MKKSCIALAIALVLSVTNAHAMEFKDIKSTDWFYADTMLAFEKGFVKGYPDGTFRQGENITNAEFIAVLDRAMGYAEGKQGSQWYDAYIDAAVAAGVITPGEITDFNAPIKREKMVEYTCKALGIAPADSLAALFADTRTVNNEWINAAFNEYLTRGKEYRNKTRVFGYGEPMTRAQLAVMGMRIFNYRTDKDGFKTEMKTRYQLSESRQDKIDSGLWIYSRGYWVPEKGYTEAGLIAYTGDDDNGWDLIAAVFLGDTQAKGTLEDRYNELKEVLTSKFSIDTADKVVDYMKTKTEWSQELPKKTFMLEGKSFRVFSQTQNSCISLYVE